MIARRPISALLRGGLGNQLFIAVAASRLAISQQTRLRLLHRDLPHGGLHVSKLLPARSDRYYETLAFRDRMRFAAASRHNFPRLLSVVAEQDVEYLNTSECSGKYLFGYFQSGIEYSDLLDQTELEILSSLEDWRNAVSQATPVDSDDIVVHVRRGDYQNRRTQRFHGLLDRRYFVRAVELLRAGGATGRVVIVSDDPDGACQFLAELQPTPALIQHHNDPIYALARLTLAKFLVICNSSFSWWGARLTRGAQIIAPESWYRDPLGPQGPQLPAWHKLEATFDYD